jgi:Tol biopolymer transport system component
VRAILALSSVLLLPATCAADESEPPNAVHGAASDGIVFVRVGETSSDLWRARVSDGATRPLTRTPSRDERWPNWSPDASLLVFEAAPPGRRAETQLVLLDPETGEESRLPTPPARSQSWPAWEPHGTRVIFTFRSRRGEGPPFGVGVVDPKSGDRVLLARGAPPKFPFIRPDLAPGGSRAVAQRRGANEGNLEVWLLEAGAEPRLLVGGDGLYASKGRFTRDAQWIVMTASQKSFDAPADIMLIRPDGSELHALASTPESDDHTPRASPTRDEIAFISNRDGKEDLFLTDLSGSAARNLTRALDVAVRVPRWSPDGERIALLARAADTPPTDISEETRRAAEVVVIDRTGRLLLRTRGYMADFMPAWK